MRAPTFPLPFSSYERTLRRSATQHSRVRSSHNDGKHSIRALRVTEPGCVWRVKADSYDAVDETSGKNNGIAGACIY